MENLNFPVLGVPKRKTKVTTLSGMVVRNFFTFHVLTDQAPRGGKSQNTGGLGPFGLGQPLGTYRISGPKIEKMQFPGARGTFGGKSI